MQEILLKVEIALAIIGYMTAWLKVLERMDWQTACQIVFTDSQSEINIDKKRCPDMQNRAFACPALMTHPFFLIAPLK